MSISVAIEVKRLTKFNTFSLVVSNSTCFNRHHFGWPEAFYTFTASEGKEPNFSPSMLTMNQEVKTSKSSWQKKAQGHGSQYISVNTDSLKNL